MLLFVKFSRTGGVQVEAKGDSQLLQTPKSTVISSFAKFSLFNENFVRELEHQIVAQIRDRAASVLGIAGDKRSLAYVSYKELHSYQSRF